MRKKNITIKDKFDSEKLLRVRVFDSNKAVTKAHKHNGYLELVYLTNTAGIHIKDGKQWTVKTPCLLVINKDDVHHWELESPISGFVLLLKKEFIAQSLDLELDKLVLEINKTDIIYLPQVEPLNQLFQLLLEEENKTVQEGILKAILSKTLEGKQLKKVNTSISIDLYHKFNALLQSDLKILNHVAYYASKLNTSPQNLNAACKKHTEHSASEIIAQSICKEASRLLIYTDNSIAEIAYILGFSDKSNFTKFFKRNMQETPSSFRELYR